MSKTTIVYRDVAPGAEDNATLSATGASEQSQIATLPYGSIIPPRYSTIERNYWPLDGKSTPYDGEPIPFWSDDLSDENGIFADPPKILSVFTQQYSSTGISIIFDTATGEYCNHVNIKWYQGGEVKGDEDFYPNKVEFFCENVVSLYDAILITFIGTVFPHRKARINQIKYGRERIFDMSEITSASVINEVGLISDELPVSTLDWTLENRRNIDYMFQFKQMLQVINDEQTIGVYYLDKFRRTSPSRYTLECYDAFGVLGETDFSGGAYIGGASAKAICESIIGDLFELEFEAADTTLKGVLAPSTSREALQQVLFAWGVCASTDNEGKIRIFSPGIEAAEIGRDRTYIGVSMETVSIVTKVIVTAHNYTQADNGGVEINGVFYSDTEQKFTIVNPDVTPTDKPRVIEVKNATLVSSDIGQATAQRVYNYYSRRDTNNARIVWRGERLGDRVTVPNAWGGTSEGNIASMRINLSNTVAADCEIKGTMGV